MSDIITLVSQLSDDQEAAYLGALRKSLPGEVLLPLRETSAQQRAQSSIAIVANPRPADVARLPNLAWVHSLWAGVEQLVAAWPKDGPPIVRLVDPEMSRTMAEAVLAWTYYLQRDMPTYRLQQTDRQWCQRVYRKPSSMEIGIVGLGTLGTCAAERLVRAGFRVNGWSRTAKNVDGVHVYHGDTGLNDMLTTADIVICLMPLTSDTRGLIDGARIAQMKRGAALINFARGPIIVEAELLDALDRGLLSHAVLDVFDIEPLPLQSRLWEHPRVTILPHISAPTDVHTAASVIAANVSEYRKTGKLPASVDLTRGY
ncbi:glyoxylate/hydroxypyruvate reductase A [Paraburkholderia sp. C35]|uniref:2-hydroxyacid dehydrogenase n=1 Tax=Paraburkholderia sp. C35 TaxID=2126993 RepID=UPI000D69DE42|nr:glyoxylate/hydroxypyruvate reductase A [Paraburkholderia sp. C35]